MTTDELLRFTLLSNWNLNGQYVAELTADLDEAHKVLQPAAGFNHPGWLLAHMNTYHPTAADLLEGCTPVDPMDAPFGMKSEPSTDAATYPPLAEQVQAFAEDHARIAAALEAVDVASLAAPIPIERWVERFPTVGSILGYLLVRHESLHIGQLSTWRRAAGLPRV